MESRSLSREVALLVLGQLSHDEIKNYKSLSIENMLELGLDTLLNHLKEQLDFLALQIELAHQEISHSEIEESEKGNLSKAREYVQITLQRSENILNVISDSLEISQLLTLTNQHKIRKEAIKRVNFVINNFDNINISLDNVMEGWKLKRLPRIDQDILRLAYVDLYNFKTPVAVSCNEAVNLANRYSDDQGRRMINGILRRLQKNSV